MKRIPLFVMAAIFLQLLLAAGVCAWPFQQGGTTEKTADAPLPPDTVKVRQAYSQAKILSNDNPQEAKRKARSGLRLARINKDRQGEGMLLALLGRIAAQTGSLDSALLLQQQALDIREKLGLANEAVLSVANIADVYGHMGQPEKGLQLALKALGRMEASGNKGAIARLSTTIGNLYESQEQYELSLKHHQRAAELYAELKMQQDLATALNNIGNSYMSLSQPDKAAHYYRLSLSSYQMLGMRKRVADTYANLGSAMLESGQETEALAMLQKALAEYRQIGAKMGQAEALNSLGKFYYGRQQYKRAEQYYQQALKLAKELSNLEHLQDIHANLYWLHKDQKQYREAMQHLEQYTDLNESLFSIKRTSAIAEANAKYEDEKRERQIQLLEKDRQLNQAYISRRTLERNVTIAGLLLTLLIALLVIRSVRQRQKAISLLAAKNQELNHKRVQELLKEQELVAVHSMLQGQETERKRIAQDLHDRLGSLLATIKLYFHLSREQLRALPERQQEQLKQGIHLLDDACQEVRRISHNMVSGVLLRFGLLVALQDLAKALTSSNQVRMAVVAHGMDDRLESHVEILLYRIVQELVSNALKHGHATEITVQLTRHRTSLNLLVEDNGRGFKAEEAAKGMGLQNIHARASQLHGTVSIDSGKGSGTTVLVDIPLPPAAPSEPVPAVYQTPYPHDQALAG